MFSVAPVGCTPADEHARLQQPSKTSKTNKTNKTSKIYRSNQTTTCNRSLRIWSLSGLT